MQLSLKDAALIKTSAAFLEDKVAELKKYFFFFLCVCVCCAKRVTKTAAERHCIYSSNFTSFEAVSALTLFNKHLCQTEA